MKRERKNVKSKFLGGDEKRGRLLKIFLEGQEFYQLKEFKKLGKEKGLNLNHLQEISLSLRTTILSILIRSILLLFIRDFQQTSLNEAETTSSFEGHESGFER